MLVTFLASSSSLSLSCAGSFLAGGARSVIVAGLVDCSFLMRAGVSIASIRGLMMRVDSLCACKGTACDRTAPDGAGCLMVHLSGTILPSIPTRASKLSNEALYGMKGVIEAVFLSSKDTAELSSHSKCSKRPTMYKRYLSLTDLLALTWYSGHTGLFIIDR